MARTGNPYGLTDNQWAFVQEYLVSLNALDAYRKAGYKGRGKSAAASAIQILRNLSVSTAIRAEKAKRAERVQLLQDAVLEELHLLSHSDITHYQIDDTGNVTLAPGVHPRAMRAVSSLQKKIIHTEAGIHYETRLWLWNKPAAVKMAGEHLGVFAQGAVKSQDIQEAQAQRGAALTKLRDQLKAIRERHTQAGEVLPI